MIIPISHEETTVRRLPWVTFGIMAACTAVLILTELHGDSEIYSSWGLVPKRPESPGLFTYMFMHAGWGHLIGNFLILFLAGPPLEDRWGRPLFAGVYVAAGLFAGGFYVLMTPGSNLPLVGASGAIAALMGASLVRFWATKIRFFYIFWVLRIITGTFWAPVWAMLPLWFLSNLFMARLADDLGVVSGVAYWCHVGGFVFGTAFAYGMRHWRIEERYLHQAIESRITVSNNPVIDEAMELRIQGEPQTAYRLLSEAAGERPDDPDVVNALFELAGELRRTDEAIPLMLGLVKQSLARGEGDLAVGHWEEIAVRAPAAKADRQLLVRLIPVLLEKEKRQRAVQALRRVVDPRLGALSSGMAFRVLELAKDVDPPSALVAARRVLEAESLHEAKRERVEALASELEKRCADLPETDPCELADDAMSAYQTDDVSIPIDHDPMYDFTLPSEEPEAPPEPGAHELDATGLLVASDSSGELVPDSVPLDQWAAGPPPPPPVAGAPGASDAPLPPPLPSSVAASAEPAASEVVPPPLPSSVAASAEPAASEVVPPPVPSSVAASAEPAASEVVPPPLPSSVAAPAEPAAPPPPPPAPESPAHDLALAASASVARFCDLKVIEAAPLELAEEGVALQRLGGGRGCVDYRRIQALAVAAVKGLSAKPVLIIDLVMNWNDTGEGPLQLIRLRSDAFDVRKLLPQATRSIDAFRALQEQLLARTGAVPLPDRDAVRGRPFRTYSDLDSYVREVLQVER
jgi:membrane associated rhomboid family serine protease